MGKSTRSERNADRMRLAEAIERRDDLAGAVASLRAAMPGQKERVSLARRAVEAAEDGVPLAKRAAAAHMAALALGEAGEDAPASVEAARRAAASAEDDLDVAKAALATLQGRLTETEFQLGMAARKVEEAARVVLADSPAIASLVTELTELQRALVDKGAALEWVFNKRLVASDVLSSPTGPGGCNVPTVIHRLSAPMKTWRELVNDHSIPGAAPWQAALTALMNDPDAPLLY